MSGPAGSVPVVTAFADRLVEAVGRKRSQLVVGLDPVPERLPPELRGEGSSGRVGAAAACESFCRGIVDAVAPFAVAVKPQSAFFEALGPAGVSAYAAVCDHARAAGLLVIADAKRGDIGSTARAYATAFLEPREGDAARGRRHRQPVYGKRLRRAVPRRLRAPRRRPLLPRQDVEPGRCRGAGSRPLRRAAALAARRRARRRRGAPASSASTGSPPSAPSSGRRTRARSPRRGGCCRGRCSCSRRRRAGREPGRPRAGVRRRGRVGARQRLALGHLRPRAGGGDWRPPPPPRRSGSPPRSGPRPAGDEHRERRNLARFAAPAAFLLGVTVAVKLLVRAGRCGSGASTTRSTRSATQVAGVFSTPARTTTGAHVATGAAAGRRYYTVRKGDTFGSIAVRERTTVSALEQLNPGVSSNTLQVGQKLRVK